MFVSPSVSQMYKNTIRIVLIFEEKLNFTLCFINFF